ncbi:MAG: Flp pilus assembly complex ATPase component TadA, partial [Candidatus Hydrogenedentes bacterium]|nr:Flp pilus assembly complex ATPase component TadA [Candidatus Hydrogenedentota bacterium]
NIDLLGIDEDMAQAVLNTISDEPGLLIVSGAPKSGVTSTLYSLLRKQDAYIKLLTTVESKSSMDLENVTQNQYGEVEKLEETFSSVIRRDPNMVLLDNCPDENIAQMVYQFAKENSIMVGWRAKDSFTALARWVMTIGSASRAIKPLRGVLCQTLIRKICPSCREPYHPDPKLLAKINMPAEQVDVFYRLPTQKPTDSKGNIVPCQTCQDSGYYGRTGVFEFLKITDDLRQLIGKKASLTHIKAAARKNKMLYMQENALAKVVQGVTSIQEVIRTFQQDPAKKQASSRSR